MCKVIALQLHAQQNLNECYHVLALPYMLCSNFALALNLH